VLASAAASPAAANSAAELPCPRLEVYESPEFGRITAAALLVTAATAAADAADAVIDTLCTQGWCCGLSKTPGIKV
jgi:hypothetical protein